MTVPAGTITAQGNGTFNVTAGLTDAAGNVGANSTATSVTVDTAAPTATVAITAIATDSGASSSDFITNDTTLTVSGTHGSLGAGETVQVSSDGGASWANVTASTATDWSYTDPTTHGTSFTYQVRIVDTVGNVGANTASQAVTIDTATPAAPSITSIPENGGGGINAAEASDGTPVVVGLAGTGAAAGDTLTINWGSQTVTYTLLAADVAGNSATVTVPLATITAQGQGTFDVTARLTDAAGNVGTNSTATSVTVDAAAPTAAVAITAIATDSGASSSDFITNDTTLTVSGTHGSLGSGEKVQVSSDGGANWVDATSTASTWSYTDPTTHATSFTYQARIVDAVGNVDINTASQAVTIDTAAPTAAVAITAIDTDSGASSSDFVTKDTTLTVSGTHGALGAGETVQVSSDGGANWANAISTAGTWSYTDPTTHGTSFIYQVRIVDAAGNLDANTASQAVTIDTAAPAAPSITAIPENADGGGIDPSEASDGTPVVVALAGTGAAAGDTLSINWGSQTVNYTLLAGDILGNSATVTVPAATIAAQGLGTFDVTARLTDIAGNASSNSTAISVNVISVDVVAPRAAVAITAIASDSGASSSDFVTNDTILTVSGTHGILGPNEKVQVSSDGGASWFDVTTSTVGTWSYADPTQHLTSFTYQARIVDNSRNVDANTASQAVTIDTVAPNAPSITSIPENGGGGITVAEASRGTPVVVGLAGTGAAVGDTLTVNWGGQSVNYTLLAADISGNSATVTVPAGTIFAEGLGTFDVTARLTDIAGNVGANSSGAPVTVAVGGGHGDVHMVSFNGSIYDFQAVGDFVAVQSTDAGNPWQVQIRTESFPGATSITTALGATLGADRVSFAVGRTNPVFVDGAPDTTLQVGAVQSLAGGTLAHPSADVYQLSWNTGESVTVTDQGDYLDWTVGLGPHDGPGSVRGLLGSNSGQATDFQLPNATVLVHPSDAEIVSVFADAWSVAPGMSLLDGTPASNHALLVQTMAAMPSATGAAHDGTGAQQGVNSDAAGVFLAGAPPLHS